MLIKSFYYYECIIYWTRFIWLLLSFYVVQNIMNIPVVHLVDHDFQIIDVIAIT